MMLHFCMLQHYTKNPDLAWLQSDDVGMSSLKGREPLQVWPENIHLAEHTGLLIRDPSWVELNGVAGRKEEPALPTHRTDCSGDFSSKDSC